MQNTAKKKIIETDIFDSDNSIDDDVKESIEEKNDKNLDLYMGNSYSYVVTMICMY